jgi:hypothetical protein
MLARKFEVSLQKCLLFLGYKIVQGDQIDAKNVNCWDVKEGL